MSRKPPVYPTPQQTERVIERAKLYWYNAPKVIAADENLSPATVWKLIRTHLRKKPAGS